MTTRFIIYNREDDGTSKRYEAKIESVTWMALLEDVIIPGMRAMGYILPETEKILEAFDVE